MSTLRQIDDVRTVSELDAQLDNALGVIKQIETEVKLARNSIDRKDPFDLMIALAEMNRLIVKQTMPLAIAAEAAALEETIREAQRIA